MIDEPVCKWCGCPLLSVHEQKDEYCQFCSSLILEFHFKFIKKMMLFDKMFVFFEERKNSLDDDELMQLGARISRRKITKK